MTIVGAEFTDAASASAMSWATSIARQSTLDPSRAQTPAGGKVTQHVWVTEVVVAVEVRPSVPVSRYAVLDELDRWVA